MGLLNYFKGDLLEHPVGFLTDPEYWNAVKGRVSNVANFISPPVDYDSYGRIIRTWPDLPVERDPAYEYGSILPFRKNIANRQVEWSPQYSDLAKSAVDAFTAPGRAYNGQIDTNSLQGIMEAQNVAQLMAEGGFASGTMTPATKRAGTLGMFGGRGAKTANLEKLGIAQKLKQAGIPDEQIWKQTGWTSGFADGKWRFEIPDNAAKFTQAEGQFKDLSQGNLAGMLNHEQAYSAYPDAANMRTSGTLYSAKRPNEFGASYSPGTDSITLVSSKPNAENSSTTLHELQHAIQQREGFARGGSPDAIARNPLAFMSPDSAEYVKTLPEYKMASPAKQAQLTDSYAKMLLGSPEEVYKRLAGEAEARLTQARTNLTPEQRLAQYPVSQFDVAPSDQIVRYGDGQAMSVVPVGERFGVRGQTYDFKDKLKKMGGTWDSNSKTWTYDNLDTAREADKVWGGSGKLITEIEAEKAAINQSRPPIYLNVPFADKDIAKRAGAQWDAGAKKWFVRDAIPDALQEYAPSQMKQSAPVQAAPTQAAMTSFTEADLVKKANAYRNGMLEGGEGYNPWEVKLEEMQRIKAQSDPIYWQSVAQDLQRKAQDALGYSADGWINEAGRKARYDELMQQANEALLKASQLNQ